MQEEYFRLLFADDEPDMLDTLRRSFRKYKNYNILTVDSGRAAIELLGHTTVDLIISDQRMPDITGDKVLKFAREHQPEAIRILLTGYSDMETLVKCVNEAGIYKYLTKPWEPEMLRLTVDRALESLSLERRLKVATEKLREAHVNAVSMLCFACEGKDEDTGFHVQRIEEYSERLALELAFTPSEAKHLGAMSRLHDIGKLSTPDAILKKPGKLDDDEWVIMKRHAENGVKILGDLSFYGLAREIAGGHHENFDGTGYPGGLRAEEIPLAARIVKVTDVFDALTSRRPYKEPWSIEQATEQLRFQAGQMFDPLVVAAFLALMDRGVIQDIIRRYSHDALAV